MSLRPKTSHHQMLRDWQKLISEGLQLEAPEDEDADETPAEEPSEEEPEDTDVGDEPGEHPEPQVDLGHAESPNDSLDNQIDSFLVKFERDAAAGEQRENKRPQRRSRLFEALSLTEAEGDEDQSDDEEQDNVTDKSEPEADTHPEAPKVPDLNIDDFTQKVARLINNYESMLDVPRSIFDRATKYLTDGYGDDVATQFSELLAQQHDIEFNDDPMAQDSDGYPVKGPPATGAEGVPSAGGGASGGAALGGGTAAV